MPEALKIILIIAAALAVMWILFMLLLSYCLYVYHLKRTSKNKWSRECSAKKDPVQVTMYKEGLEWAEKYKDKMKELHIVNEGLNLYAEYYDLSSPNTVIMVSGRTEGLRYGYYFAKPYTDHNWNVLVIDQRAHGNSDGKYNTIGFNEHKDLIAWALYIEKEFNVKTVIFHGICIGASSSLFALTAADTPAVLKGMVAEGMYPCFYESFRNHMVEFKQPQFPCLQLVDMWMRVLTGFSMKVGPKDVIDKLDKPILMLHSREDAYSLPRCAQELYDTCNAKKKLEWFEHGKHSQLRYTDKQHYDRAVTEFIKENF